MRIIVSSKFSKSIKRHLAKKTEQVAFLFLNQTDIDSFECKDAFLVPELELINQSEYHSEVSDRVIADVIKKAATIHSCLCEIHSHPFSKSNTRFSPSDMLGFAEFVPHVWWRLKGLPYFAIVFGSKDCDAMAWLKNPKRPTLVSQIQFGDDALTPTGLSYHGLMSDIAEQERYARQEFFFGKDGQKRLQQQAVVIVGVGGIGSHVAQQLAYLGVTKFVLIDNDKVDGTNLNRLIGATTKDVGVIKTEVVARMITNVQPHARIQQIESGLLTKSAIDAIKFSDFVFGCLDHDGPRSVLLEACCSFKRPYIDLATDVPDENTFGGRLVFTGIGGGCLRCHEQLDDDEIDWYFSNTEQREEKDRIYGVERKAFGATGPSVVFLNGIVASLGVQEFAVHVNPVLRSPFPLLLYRGNMGLISRPVEKPKPDCYFCKSMWNAEASSDVYRYANPQRRG